VYVACYECLNSSDYKRQQRENYIYCTMNIKGQENKEETEKNDSLHQGVINLGKILWLSHPEVPGYGRPR
jgi:hypothetical protein